MSNFTLYRKYRPKTFGELSGQETIVSSFLNIIKSKRIVNSIILYGQNGVGKTTIARLYAKAINCTNFTNDICNSCDNCKSIDKSTMDVFEIDAASNNSVDQIRKIIELTKRNSILKYKVYIIDEFHMLSNSAYNAILKTLEEPNENNVFILATTEYDKIADTIKSRCITFRLAKIAEKDIYSKLIEIISSENINCDDKTIKVISIVASGSLRRALSILQELLLIGSNKIIFEDVKSILRYPDTDIFNKLDILTPEDLVVYDRKLFIVELLKFYKKNNDKNKIDTLFFDYYKLDKIVDDEIFYYFLLELISTPQRSNKSNSLELREIKEYPHDLVEKIIDSHNEEKMHEFLDNWNKYISNSTTVNNYNKLSVKYVGVDGLIMISNSSELITPETIDEVEKIVFSIENDKFHCIIYSNQEWNQIKNTFTVDNQNNEFNVIDLFGKDNVKIKE